MLEQTFERQPTYEEIASQMETAPKDVKTAMLSNFRHVSMDAPLTTDSETESLYDVLDNPNSISPDEILMGESLRKEIERLLTTLPYREADILRMYYGLNGQNASTLEEIGEEFFLTRERVRQIKEKAIRKLKSTTKSKILRGYLG